MDEKRKIIEVGDKSTKVEILKQLENQTLIDQARSNHISYKIPEQAANQIIAYYIMLADINIIIDYTKELIRIKTPEQVRNPDQNIALLEMSLWQSIIILYGRLFSNSDATKLDRNKCVKNASESIKKIHKYIIDLRNKFVGHRLNTDAEAGFVCYNILRGTNQCSIVPNIVKQKGPSIREVSEYLELFELVKPCIEEHFNKSKLNAMKEMDDLNDEEFAKLKYPEIKL